MGVVSQEWWAILGGPEWVTFPSANTSHQAKGFCLCCSFSLPFPQILTLSTLLIRPWSWNSSNFIDRDAEAGKEGICPNSHSTRISELRVEGLLTTSPLHSVRHHVTFLFEAFPHCANWGAKRTQDMAETWRGYPSTIKCPMEQEEFGSRGSSSVTLFSKKAGCKSHFLKCKLWKKNK